MPRTCAQDCVRLTYQTAFGYPLLETAPATCEPATGNTRQLPVACIAFACHTALAQFSHCPRCIPLILIKITTAARIDPLNMFAGIGIPKAVTMKTAVSNTLVRNAMIFVIPRLIVLSMTLKPIPNPSKSLMTDGLSNHSLFRVISLNIHPGTSHILFQIAVFEYL